MRIVVVPVVVSLFCLAAFSGGFWLGLPSGPRIDITEEQAAQCKSMGGCFIVPKVVIQQLSQQSDCKGRT